MADMGRANEFVITTGGLDIGTAAADIFRMVAPRSFTVVKWYGIKNAATTGAAVITLESSGGNVNSTMTVPTVGAADDIVEVDVRPLNDQNGFSEGSRLIIKTDGGAAGGDLVYFTLVCRPL